MRTQTRESRNQFRPFWALSVGILLVAASARASILTFEIDSAPNNQSMQTVHPNYGDNVSSTTQTDGTYTNHYLQGNAFTPDITLSYSQSSGTGTASQNYYHDGQWLVGVDYLTGSAGSLPAQYYLTFTPTVLGDGVQVNSFNLMRYITGTETVDWKLHQDTSIGTVFDSGSLSVATSFPGVTVNTAGTGYTGTVVLEIDHLTGDPGGLAIDNVNFDQTVPEPSSTIVLIGVGGLLAWRRRRNG